MLKLINEITKACENIPEHRKMSKFILHNVVGKFVRDNEEVTIICKEITVIRRLL